MEGFQIQQGPYFSQTDVKYLNIYVVLSYFKFAEALAGRTNQFNVQRWRCVTHSLPGGAARACRWWHAAFCGKRKNVRCQFLFIYFLKLQKALENTSCSGYQIRMWRCDIKHIKNWLRVSTSEAWAVFKYTLLTWCFAAEICPPSTLQWAPSLWVN